MNHIKLFKNFTNESLVTGKFDFQILSETIYDIVLKISEEFGISTKDLAENIRHRKDALYLFDVNGGDLEMLKIKPQDKKFNINNPDYHERLNNDIQDRLSIYYDGSDRNIALMNPYGRYLVIGESFMELGKDSRESVIAHEMSHFIDPDVTRKGSKIDDLKKAGLSSQSELYDLENEVESLNKLIKNNPEKANEYQLKIDKILGKFYLRRQTEIEAFVSQITYIVDKLLDAQPEKTEELKKLLRAGDFRVYNVFTELEDMSGHIDWVFGGYQTPRDKLLKKLTTIVSDRGAPDNKFYVFDFSFNSSKFISQMPSNPKVIDNILKVYKARWIPDTNRPDIYQIRGIS
jgi:DNA-directed RNA polymerase subunit F